MTGCVTFTENENNNSMFLHIYHRVCPLWGWPLSKLMIFLSNYIKTRGALALYRAPCGVKMCFCRYVLSNKCKTNIFLYNLPRRRFIKVTINRVRNQKRMCSTSDTKRTHRDILFAHPYLPSAIGAVRKFKFISFQ